MNRFAKITALAAISAISLTACGANGDKGSSSASSSKTTSTASSAAQPSDSSADAVSFKPACPGGSISGAGSSAQLNAINQVISDYKAACSSATVNYSPTGSGAGVKSFIGRQTDWAGSDSVLNADKGEPDKAKQRCNADPWHLPMAAGPIAVVYNVDGVKDLTLSTATLAKIFSGAITNWNDDAIKKENPKAALPSAQIEVFYRKDESGTTDNFTKFLNKAAGDIWTEKHSKT